MSCFKAKMQQIRFRLGLTALSDPLTGFKGPNSKGRERRKDGREGKGRGEGREDTGSEGKERNGGEGRGRDIIIIIIIIITTTMFMVLSS